MYIIAGIKNAGLTGINRNQDIKCEHAFKLRASGPETEILFLFSS